MSKQNVDLVRAAYAAFGRGDINAVLDLMDPKIDFRVAENSLYYRGSAYVGRDDVGSLFARIPVDWDGFEVVPETYHDAGDVVAVRGRYRGTYRATGKSMYAQVAHFWTLRNGKLAEFQQYIDTAALREITGQTTQSAAGAISR
jgi:ketosteroid isomerase-like protein